jgi:predicted nuclease of predicted toxin-antitoxin system
MNFVIDMNLSPTWVDVFTRHGWTAVHWTTVGDPRATDRTILAWAVAHDAIVFTHDLDFGAILAATGARGPSVLQVRAHDLLPAHLGDTVVAAIGQFADFLTAGALLTVDARAARVRLLPLVR